MKKQKINVTDFGRIVEEIPTCKFDCAMTHIYVNELTEEAISYLTNLAHKLPVEELQGYMVHWDNRTENLLGFFEVTSYEIK